MEIIQKLTHKVDFTTVQKCCNNKEATIKSIASKYYACIKLAKSILGKQIYRNEGDKHSKRYNSKDTMKKDNQSQKQNSNVNKINSIINFDLRPIIYFSSDSKSNSSIRMNSSDDDNNYRKNNLD